MLSFNVRPAVFIIAACLFLTQMFCVIPTANAVNEIVILRGPSLDGEGTPFEEPEDDGKPKLPYFDGDDDDAPERGNIGEDQLVSGNEMAQKWLPLLIWFARIRF